MPLIANFETGRGEADGARIEASLKMAKGFELVQRAVTQYEAKRGDDVESVVALLSEARASFRNGAEIFSSIVASSEDLPRGVNLDVSFTRFSVRERFFEYNLGRLSPVRLRGGLSSERDLVTAASAIGYSCDATLEAAGHPGEAAFEQSFRDALIDLAHLHAFSVALSEVFAQAYKR